MRVSYKFQSAGLVAADPQSIAKIANALFKSVRRIEDVSGESFKARLARREGGLSPVLG
jgi:hypothetical protein